jgi:dTDP-4-amino-4,6-dideoxygalactose transaminase
VIPFNKPYLVGNELQYIEEACRLNKLSGDGAFTKKCQAWLEEHTGCKRALLTQSGTAALEMAAMLIDTQPGDEIILPSFTFVSTANAFLLRGGVPVFVDIRSDTLNIDESKIEAAITPKTKAIVPVHYAGVGCNMSAINEIAQRHNLYVIEDAAQAMIASYQHQALGTLGHLAALSFHDTKNIISGEGGALLINDAKFFDRAEIIREKGTDRGRFFRGEIDKYTWQDIGSSFLPSEIIAAFLWAQLQEAENITQRRMQIWNNYHAGLQALEQAGRLRRPIVPQDCQHNAHMYYLLLPDPENKTKLKTFLAENGVGTATHYVPLHSSPAGQKYAKTHGILTITDTLPDQLIRLPLWIGVEEEVERIIQLISRASS